MGKAIIILAGQSNVSRVSDAVLAALDAQYGRGNYVLVQVSSGGSPLTRVRDSKDDWLTNGELPARLSEAVIDALRSDPGSHVAGILWLQGEADSTGSSDPSRYAVEFNALFDGLRRDVARALGSDAGLDRAPIVISELSDNAPEAPNRSNWGAITAAQERLAANSDLILTVDPDDVAAANRVSSGSMFADGLHYAASFAPLLASALVSAMARASGDDSGGAAGGDTGGTPERGTGANDLFAARAGANLMQGLDGDDVYFVDNPGDRIVEEANEGNDLVYSAVSIALRDHSQHIEALTLTGSQDLAGTGNALGNVLRGNSGDNLLNGAWGDDTIFGGAGNDTLQDSRGQDLMYGGPGNDSYVVDDPRDRVIEYEDEGTDTVYSEVSIALRTHGQYIENVTLTGRGNTDVVGNAQDNVLRGNAGNNVLNGAWGNDTIYGGAGNDTLQDSRGADRLVGGTGNDVYIIDNEGDRIIEHRNEGSDTVRSSITIELRHHSQYLETLILTGTGDIDGTGTGYANTIIGNSGDNHLNGAWGDDTIYGGAGNDTIRDSSGADLMVGGTGNDVYYVDATGDRIVEREDEGVDTVFATISIDLRSYGHTIENLYLIGSANLNATGSGYANTLRGNEGNNRLNGAWGDDTVYGGAGNDTISDSRGDDRFSGGSGADTFVFTDDFGRDVITDFNPAQRGEVIDLSDVSAILSFADLVENHLRTANGHALIFDGDGNTITLMNVAPEALEAADFLF